MKFKGFQKYFLLLMLSLGIAQGSHAFVSKNNVSTTPKSSTFQSSHHQSNANDFLFELVEENNDDDSNETQHNLDFIVPQTNDFTFHHLQNETVLLQKYASSYRFHNQKINILNCTFLI